MASLTLQNLCTITTTRSNSLSSACPLYKQRRQTPTITLRCVHKVSCRSKEGGESPSVGRVNRRNVLIGLGGSLYTGTGLGGNAIGAPITPPNLSNCEAAELPATATATNFFPPNPPKIVDFKLPSPSLPMRKRQAGHLLDNDYITKYNKAISLMKALPDDDPRNFKQQASIHCAYCSGGHNQVGFPDLELQIQNSWLLLPWHRYYLYFNEKILGKLIGDDKFALPFRCWDTPKGMQLPHSLGNLPSYLYDNNLRNANQHPPTTVKLDYSLSDDPTITDQPNTVNINNLYSVAPDPIFLAHHSNVDRIWATSKGLGGLIRNFTDPDWLNTAFLFYDENAQLVRAKVRDCLDTMNLRYVYQEVETPWLTASPAPRKAEAMKAKASEDAVKPNNSEFPVTLNSVTKLRVQRPKKRRSKREKEEEEEILVIEGIELDREMAVKFDVYINDKEDKALGPVASEFAGSFINVPHMHGKRTPKIQKTRLKLGITDLLEEIDAEGDESILVSLVPRKGKGGVSIGGIRIEFGS